MFVRAGPVTSQYRASIRWATGGGVQYCESGELIRPFTLHLIENFQPQRIGQFLKVGLSQKI